MIPYWGVQGLPVDEIKSRRERLVARAKLGAFPIGITACFAVWMLAMVYLLSISV